MTIPTEDTAPRRPNGNPVRAIIGEFGSLSDGWGEMRAHTLMTPDPLKHVLLPNYFKGRFGLAIGDWIFCTASCDKNEIQPAILLVVAAEGGKHTAKERTGATKVRVVLLSEMRVPVPSLATVLE